MRHTARKRTMARSSLVSRNDVHDLNALMNGLSWSTDDFITDDVALRGFQRVPAHHRTSHGIESHHKVSYRMPHRIGSRRVIRMRCAYAQMNNS